MPASSRVVLAAVLAFLAPLAWEVVDDALGGIAGALVAGVLLAAAVGTVAGARA